MPTLSNAAATPASRSRELAPGGRAALVTLSLILHAVLVTPLHQLAGPPAGALGVLPVALTGWLLGSGYAIGMAVLTMGAVVVRIPSEARGAPFAILAFALIGWVVGQLRKVTQRLRQQQVEMEQAVELLKDREALMAAAQAISHTGSWEWSVATDAVWWSVEMHRIHGTDPQTFVPTFEAAMAFIHPDDRPRLRATAQSVVSLSAGTEEVQYRILRGDGSVGVIRSQTERTVDAAGKVIKMLGTAQDITDRVNLESRLLLSDRLASVGTLAGGVAHEINNPLSYVAFNLEFLAEELAGVCVDPTSQLVKDMTEAISDAREGAERIRRIVRDLKSFSRADDDAPGPTDVRRVIELATKMAANEIKPRAQLRLDYQAEASVIANDSRLGQVVLNLLVNAAQAIPEGHAAANAITVRTRRDRDTHLLIEVSDTGSGIAPEIANRIFDPFFTTKPVGVGTGLGLSICHGIVESFGGEITMRSEVGKGSTFTVRLKVAPPSSLPAPKPGATHGPARARVLVIDDEPLLGSSIRRLLGNANDVDLVTSGKAALDQISTVGGYDLVLCDLMMPELTGMDVYQRLLATNPQLAHQIVFMTGGAFTPRAAQFMEEVDNTFLQKPVSVSQLTDILASRAARRSDEVEGDRVRPTMGAPPPERASAFPPPCATITGEVAWWHSGGSASRSF